MSSIHCTLLEGCTPSPLACYLKALGLLRVVGEQADPEARGSWHNERFVLTSTLSGDGLLQFLLQDYRPSPVVSPWNGGSGFNPKDAREFLEALENGRADRFEPYRRTIYAARRARQRLDLSDKATPEDKARLLTLCRSLFPDEALAWLDAAVVLTQERPSYPPLLGTGGNDGRLDFSNNQMKRLTSLINPVNGEPRDGAERFLRASLFGDPVMGLADEAIGQFFPSAAGGVNASTGFDGKSQVNPWDYVLMLEGALLFAASAARRLQDQSAAHLSAPFTVRTVAGGYGSSAPQDEAKSRAEIWLPLWEQPISLPELRHLFSEGRARVGSRLAATGLDFARAAANLGVDRGLTAFQRVGFQERNGQAYFALTLGRFEVVRNPQASLIDSLDGDGWLQQMNSRVTDNYPASVRSRLHQLQTALFDLCRLPDHRGTVQRALVAVGALHRSFALMPMREPKDHPWPCPLLDPRWAVEADDGSPEFDAAAALAGLSVSKGQGRRWSIRHLLDPVQRRGERIVWQPERQSEILRPANDLEAIAAQTLQRILVALLSYGRGDTDAGDATVLEETSPIWSDRAPRSVHLGTILQWISGTLDMRRAADLFWGLLLVRRASMEWDERPHRQGEVPLPTGAWSLLKLCFAGRRLHRGSGEPVPVPLDPDILFTALAGQGERAVRRAVGRLRSSLLPPLVDGAWLPDDRARRFASAVLLPLRPSDLFRLDRQVLKPPAEAEA